LSLNEIDMAFPVRVCAFVGRFSDPRVEESLALLLPRLASQGIEVIVSVALPERLAASATLVPVEEIGPRADLVIAIGGDGTLLYAARLVARHGVPLLGINRGRLGFLTDVMPQDVLAGVDAALAGQSELDRRPLLEARLAAAAEAAAASAGPAALPGPAPSLALNDVVLQKLATGRMIDFETWIDGRYVNTHAGDGIVVATATGSTAYALSCGGPIVQPNLDVLVLAPISPHTLSDRPIVVSGRSRIEIRLAGPAESHGQVVCDGTVLGELAPGERLHVELARDAVTLLHPTGYDYFRLLRSKLQWGRGSVDHSR
jgi:NAD+ kinase